MKYSLHRLQSLCRGNHKAIETSLVVIRDALFVLQSLFTNLSGVHAEHANKCSYIQHKRFSVCA